jgi:serine/threonine-protein kinase
VALYVAVYGRGAPRASADERRAGVRGWAAQVLRVQPVVQRALTGLDISGMDLLLVDESDLPDRQVLFATATAPDGTAPAEDAPRARKALPFADRRWTLVLTALPDGQASRGWAVLAGGVALSALGAALLSAASSVRRLRRQVAAARKLGQYTLAEKLGQGGMGAVYKARHAMLRRPTAVKLLRPSDADDRRLARFEQEVQMTSRLTHPNTIAIYDYGRTPEGVFYYAMEYIDGLSLEELVDNDGPQPPGRVIHLLAQVCGALAEAHAVSLIHRDVKPANLMLCRRGGIPDFIKVLDFGLVKELDRGSLPPLSTAGAFVGTPLYLAPEAIQAPDTIDARSDLYAVGAVGYFLLTGMPVFQGRTLIEICGQHLHAEPVPPSRRAPYPLPPALEALILRCLAKDPAARPASALEVQAALQAIVVLDPWRQAEAERWWRERGGAVSDAAQSARAESLKLDDEPVLHTVAIDLRRRKHRGETP